jgi:hypothetical protein
MPAISVREKAVAHRFPSMQASVRPTVLAIETLR